MTGKDGEDPHERVKCRQAPHPLRDCEIVMTRPLLFLAALALVAADPAPNDVARERDKLLGSWGIVSDLGSVPDAERGLPLLTFTADKIIASRFSVENGKLAVRDEREIGTYTLDPTTSPRSIDIMVTGGKAKGRTARCIYRLEGEDLTLCLGDPDGARPTRFATTKSSALMEGKRSTPEAQRKAIAALEALRLQPRGRLPTARTAKPIDPKLTDVLIVDVTNEGRVPLFGRDEPLGTAAEVGEYLQREFAVRKRQTGPRGVNPALLLRADKDADVLPVYLVAEQAAALGFSRLLLQVQRKPGEYGQLEFILPDWRRPETFPDVTVTAKTIRDGVNDGNLSVVVIETGAGETRAPNLDALAEQLKKIAEKAGPAGKESIRICPEAKLKVEGLVEVVDAALGAGFATMVLCQPPDMGRPPILARGLTPPNAAFQSMATQQIKTLYQASYAQLSPAELGRRLHRAAEICNDPTARFVLLREAADAAGRGGNIAASLAVLDQVAAEYGVDIWLAKLDKFKNAPGTKDVCEAALKQAGAAALQGRQEYGIRFMKLARDAARQTKDADLIQFTEERRVLLKLPNVDDVDPFAPLPSTPAPAVPPSANKAETKPAEGRNKGQDDSYRDPQGAILWYVVPAGVVVLLLGGTLVWWLRRGDAAVRNRLAEARKDQFSLPPGEGPPS